MKKSIKIMTMFMVAIMVTTACIPKSIFAATGSKYTIVKDKKQYNYDGTLAAQISYKKVVFKGKSKAKDKINKSINKYVRAYMSIWDELKDYAVSLNTDEATVGADNGYTNFELKMSVSKNDKKYISVKCQEYSYYQGAAHPNSYIFGLNYSTKTGKKLTIKNVVDENLSEIKEKIIKKLDKMSKDDIFFEDYKDIIYKYKAKDFTFYIKKNYVHVIINTDEIAPHAAGYFDVKLKLK